MADPGERPEMEELYLSTASESAKRASVLPTKGSEDMESLLGHLVGTPQAPSESNEYLPNQAVEWVVHAKIRKPLEAKAVAERFGQAWREKHGGLTIFGRDSDTGRWTYLVSADGPKQVDGLQFAWDYFSSWSDDAEVVSPDVYQARVEAIQQQLASLATVEVRADVSPLDAHTRSKVLSRIGDQLDRSVLVRLVAPRHKTFSGREIWDVMLCLGLRWGDMDCFHWDNATGVGGDYHFDVWTSTAPGYFLPEEVAADRVHVEDLVFGFSIPRSADPATVFERMMRAIRYSQERLGGTIQGEDGQPLNEAATAEEIESIAEQLARNGFPPGSDSALQQF